MTIADGFRDLWGAPSVETAAATAQSPPSRTESGVGGGRLRAFLAAVSTDGSEGSQNTIVIPRRVLLQGFSALVLLVALVSGCGRGKPPTAHPSTASQSVAAPTAAVPQFVDQARVAGLRFVHDNGHHGPFYYPEMIGGGCALLDVAGDGWLDVFLVNGAPLPGRAVGARGERFSDRLYRNDHHGTEERRQGSSPAIHFTDITRRAGVSGIDGGRKAYGIGCAVGDFDNDGHDDLLVTTYGRCLLYRNNGDGTFTDVAARAGLTREGFWTSAAFFDADNDGFLDLLICQYIRYHPGDDIACGTSLTRRDYCPPGFFPPTRSALYHNNGNGTGGGPVRFTDVTERAGLVSPYNKALGVVTADFDGDGDQDIYIACDLTPNLFYINQGNGTFREVAVERGVAFNEAGQPQASMGVDFRDYDGDLRPDLLVTNYWFEDTNLFKNRENGFFSDESYGAGLGTATLHRVGWGAALRDFDNDGRRDVYSHNGHVMLHPGQTTPGAQVRQRDQLFLQRPGGKFEEVSDHAGPWFREGHLGRGAAFGDVDNNGTIDILAAQINAPPALLLNHPGAGHWLEMKLVGTRSNRNAIGARVRVTAGGLTQCDEVRSAYSYASANDLRLHFGLGAATRADRIEIRWPSGRQEVRTDVPADQIVTIREGDRPLSR
jgi:hypothetical protein